MIFLQLALSLIITGVVYFVFPLIYVHKKGKVRKGKARVIALINFLICHIIFLVIAIYLDLYAGSFGAPILWLFVTEAYLHDKTQDKKSSK
jgi:hypothetical protein